MVQGWNCFTDHPDMVDRWREAFWEDDEDLWYKCIDKKNEGVVVEPHQGPDGGQVGGGDRRVWNERYKCTERNLQYSS